MPAESSVKITFTASDIGSRTLVLLLAFDFATSNVYPLPSRQEQHPVVWKILKFQTDPATLVHDVTYTNRLAFTKAERQPPLPKNPERWILHLDPKVFQEVDACQETMLVQDPNKPKLYSFAEPIKLTYSSSVAMNGVQDPMDKKTHKQTKSQVDIAFGFYETEDGSNPAQILCFHEIPQYMPVSLKFVPFLQAYFVPEDFYCEGDVLTMPIPTPVALQVDINSLSKENKYSISIDDTKRAIIKPDSDSE